MVQVMRHRNGPVEARMPSAATNLRSPEEAAVTPEETQTEIKSLRAQMLQLRQQQDAQKKYWFRCGAIVYSISTALLIGNVASPTPLHDILLFAAMQLLVLGCVFSRAGMRPTDTTWSGLKWAFSSDKHYSTASRPGA